MSYIFKLKYWDIMNIVGKAWDQALMIQIIPHKNEAIIWSKDREKLEELNPEWIKETRNHIFIAKIKMED